MHCPACGADASAGTKFCRSCGAPSSVAGSLAPPPTTPPPPSAELPPAAYSAGPVATMQVPLLAPLAAPGGMRPIGPVGGGGGPSQSRGLAVIGAVVVAIVVIVMVTQSGSSGESQSDAQVKADLRNAAIAEETYFTDNVTYTDSTTDLEAEGFYPAGNDVIYIEDADSSSYCLMGISNTSQVTSYYDSETGAVSTTPCY